MSWFKDTQDRYVHQVHDVPDYPRTTNDPVNLLVPNDTPVVVFSCRKATD